MTSQTNTPTRPACGYNLPMNQDFALLGEQGWIVAIVKWVSQDNHKITEVIYALGEANLALVPRLGGDVDVEAWYRDMIAKDRLVAYRRQVVLRHEDVLRIDDFRHYHSYRVYSGPKLSKGPRLVPGAVYYCYVGDDSEVGEYPRLEGFEEVMGLRHDPAAVYIDDVQTFVGMKYSDPAVIARLGGLRKTVRVQNETAIQWDFVTEAY